MPEARQGMSLVREATGSFTGGFWIRRAAYPSAVAASRTRRVLSSAVTTDEKENIPPSRAAAARRRARTRKSPLPDWYPRTPLRDITIIVNALERRRIRARAARTQQRNSGSPVAGETMVSEQNPVSEALPSPAAASCSSLSPAEHSSNASAEVVRPTEYEKKLDTSIDEMEKFVMENLKRSGMPPAKKAKRSLLLMR